ncbi:hypothetical protein KA012_02070 [Candidatus Woesebacteria bacterium]|nr:hypothetical protein [Candidatus Woesebacteria bacterium]
MSKISLYYTVLLMVVAVQFASSVIGRSVAVQQSASLAHQQKQLSQLEKQETNLIAILGSQTSIVSVGAPTTSYIAISNPITVLPSSLVATR